MNLLKKTKNPFLRIGESVCSNNIDYLIPDISLIPIDYCHLVILNIVPCNIESQVTSQGPQEVLVIFISFIRYMYKTKCINYYETGIASINSRSTFY